MTTQVYNGPAGVTFSPDELLIVWAALSKSAPEEVELITRLRRFLEAREEGGDGDRATVTPTT